MQGLQFCLRRMLRLSGESVSVRSSPRAARQKQPLECIWETEMILTSNCHNMTCLRIFPFAVSLANCFAAMIFLKQTLRMVRIRLPGRSAHLIAIIDFVSRLSVGFSSQINLHPRSLGRAATFGAPLPSQRYRATAFKRSPAPPPQPKRAIPFVCSEVPATAPFVAPFVVHMSLMARF
jgi:hypothetical protein